MLVVVAYDIADDRRRNRVASELENFGQRVQYSVFECHLTQAQLKMLQGRLASLIVEAEDRVRYYTLCERDMGRILIDGFGEVTQDWDYVMV